MSKSFKESPFDKFNNNIELETNLVPKKAVISTKSIEFDKSSRKVGRPKTKQGEFKTINIAVPIEILNKLKNVKEIYQGNLTHYINKLIEKDLNENYDKYLEIVDNLKLFK